MNKIIYDYRLLIALAISHVFLAILFTIELKIIDIYTTKEKIIWFFIIWLIPVIGLFWFYQQKTKDSKLTRTINQSD